MSLRLINDAYIADTARVIGRVTLGRSVNVWYGATIRGDVAPIVVGDETNVQENAVIHGDEGTENVIGSRVTIGHGAIVHGVEVGDESLIGINATLLAASRVGRGCLIGAGAVLAPGVEVPDGMVVMGVPGKVIRPVTEEERQAMADGADEYLRLARLHIEQGHDRCVQAWPGGDPAATAAQSE